MTKNEFVKKLNEAKDGDGVQIPDGMSMAEVREAAQDRVRNYGIAIALNAAFRSRHNFTNVMKFIRQLDDRSGFMAAEWERVLLRELSIDLSRVIEQITIAIKSVEFKAFEIEELFV